MSQNHPDFYSFDELADTAMVPTDWIIEDYIPAAETILAYGQSQAGKTFLVIDQGLAIATGQDWHGHKVPQARPVIYVASEGRKGIGRRVLAWKYYRSQTKSGTQIPFYMMKEPLLLDDSGNVTSLKKLLSMIDDLKPGLVIVDVLSDMAPNTDENSRAFGHVFNVLRSIGEQTGVAFLILHHTGWAKNTQKRPRGSSSVFQATDNAWAIEGKALPGGEDGNLLLTIVTLEATKSRNEDRCPDISLTLRKLHPADPAAHISGRYMAASDLSQPLQNAPKTAAALIATQRNPQGVDSLQALGDTLGISRSGAKGHADRLLEWGYVEEVSNGRSKGLISTQKGWDAIATLSQPDEVDGSYVSQPPWVPKEPGVAIGDDKEGRQWTLEEIEDAENGHQQPPPDEDPYGPDDTYTAEAVEEMLKSLRLQNV